MAARLAYGSAQKVALSTGEDLLGLTRASEIGEGYKLRLNGELVMISSAMTSVAVEATLDRFERDCTEHADGLADEFAHLRAAVLPGAPPFSRGFPGAGVMRRSDGERGVVVCFATGRAVSRTEGFQMIADF